MQSSYASRNARVFPTLSNPFARFYADYWR